MNRPIFHTRLIGFAIFFFIQLLFILFIDYKNYLEEKKNLQEVLKRQIEICSLKLQCPGYEITFEKKGERKPNRLYEEDTLFMLFAIPQSKNYYLKIALSKERYHQMLGQLFHKTLALFILHLLIITFTSLLFSYLLLYPIRRSHEINTTFIKDILHDFNTPISALKVNLYLLKKECHTPYVQKIEKNIAAILNLQNNLKAYISKPKLTIERFDIAPVIKEKIEFYKTLYPTIRVHCEIPSFFIATDKFGFERIVDNILSNAFKYNKKNGSVTIILYKNRLIIEDEGKGIKDPAKAFHRFYKEQERGLGLGLSIVKNFSKMLNIPVSLEPKEQGTRVVIDLGRVVKR